MPSIFNIGVSGLNAANAALTTVGHNIANINTPGYTRQLILQSENIPQNLGQGFIGRGVSVDDVIRSYDKFLGGQMQGAQSKVSYYSSQLDQLNQVDNLLADTTVGLGSAMQDMFTAMQTMSGDPASGPSRQTTINMTQAMVSKFATVDNRLNEIQAGVNGQITATVASINGLATQIATLNDQIAALTGGGGHQQPNDLLDKRDQAMLDLNKLVSAQYVQQSDGSYSVFIGNGQTLVNKNRAVALSTQPDPSNPLNQQVVYPNGTGAGTVIPNNLLSGGSLGGYLAFRDGALLATRQKIGTLAIDLSAAINYQSQLGLDANGNAGQPMFKDLSSFAATPEKATAAMQLLITDPTKLAAASSLRLTPGSMTDPGNTGIKLAGVSATLPGSYGWTSATAAGAPQLSSHPVTGMTSMQVTASATLPVTITATITGGPANGQTFNVVSESGVSNGYKLVDNSMPPKDVGISFKMSASMPAGMSFAVQPTPAGTTPLPGDNGNWLKMLSLQNRPLVDDKKDGTNTGLQSFGTHYATTTSYVGNVTNTVSLASAAQKTTLQQASTSFSNVSGVNLDQEAADLLRYQQAYQASGKVIKMAQDAFQSVLALMG